MTLETLCYNTSKSLITLLLFGIVSKSGGTTFYSLFLD
ncbi:hypothetical protein MNB_SUP05-SYMBIONT-5-987 [hydrothermal vent metagenome]|uniref:Uncharacterized protein n=1 Tax=hydrothermal vent metagenome TaxID=652676 RepID=A0A1W1E4P7_9ZZZZ